MAWWFVVGGAVSLSAAVDVDIGSQYLLIHSGAHGLGCSAWIATFELDAAYYLGACLFDNATYEFLQGLLGLGIGRESRFEHLLLLQDDCIVNFEFYHTPIA